MLFNSKDSIFGGPSVKLEAKLKNPNQYKTAVLFENLNRLPSSKRKEFPKSMEARMMLKEGIIDTETLERLANETNTGTLKVTVCHMAKENGDPLWDELVKARLEERRIMNDLMEKYSQQAEPIADSSNKEIVEACIPEYFRT